MASAKTPIVVLSAGLLLAGCSSLDIDSLIPSLTGEDQPPAATTQQIPPSPAERSGQPLNAPTATAAAPAVSPTQSSTVAAAPSGTFVGQKVAQLRNELQRLQGSIAQNASTLQSLRGQTVQDSQRYHGTVAAISARLQVGTTPGNPVLVQQWNQAQGELNQISADIAAMNTLSNRVASDATMAAYLLESVRAAYGLSGAVEEDHRQLRVLEDEVNRTVVQIERLLNELSEDIARQSNYVATERTNLNTLALGIKNGELYGTSLTNRAYSSALPLGSDVAAAPLPSAPGTANSALFGNRRPLVVIRFDRPNVDYQQALYTAVNQALQRRPDVTFDLVAVSPTRGTPGQATLGATAAKRHAEGVLRSLTDMGLPAGRVSLSAIQSTTTQTPEVHLFVR